MKKTICTVLFLTLTTVGLSQTNTDSREDGNEKRLNDMKEFDSNYAHTVYFWLDNPNNKEDCEAFETSLQKFLDTSAFAKTKFIGKPPRASRDVVDGSFTYSLIVTFESAEAQKNYQDEAPHKIFIAESSKLWTKVIVYDSQAIKYMISFRSASVDDYSAIAGLHAKSWQQNYRGIFSDHFLNKEVLTDRLAIWKDRLESPKSNQFVILAEIENSLVGFVCCNIDDDAEYGTLIDNLHVATKFIGQRIGEKLMVDAALYLEEKNRPSMYLWVLIGNSKAIRFYERMGGRPIETINDFDIGDREVTKTRYYWSSLKFIRSLQNKEIGK